MSRSFQCCLGWENNDQKEVDSPEIGLTFMSDCAVEGITGPPWEYLSGTLLSHSLLYVQVIIIVTIIIIII